MIEFNHFNFNVLDLEKSLAFYKEALGLEKRVSLFIKKQLVFLLSAKRIPVTEASRLYILETDVPALLLN